MSYGGSYDFFRPFDKEIVSSECKKLNGRIYVNLKPRTYDCRVNIEKLLYAATCGCMQPQLGVFRRFWSNFAENGAWHVLKEASASGVLIRSTTYNFA